ncbi:unnamed protein product [Pipistrellus nathusii]|uniref:Uncharacterized protein n=1 Tax=Pipistrellus nathusii TaxID=59473 RepID=A0ABN9ZC87_PIPNA
MTLRVPQFFLCEELTLKSKTFKCCKYWWFLLLHMHHNSNQRKHTSTHSKLKTSTTQIKDKHLIHILVLDSAGNPRQCEHIPTWPRARCRQKALARSRLHPSESNFLVSAIVVECKMSFMFSYKVGV